jgi:hypothetical protein
MAAFFSTASMQPSSCQSLLSLSECRVRERKREKEKEKERERESEGGERPIEEVIVLLTGSKKVLTLRKCDSQQYFCCDSSK